MIAALNRPHELRLHIRAAMTNGLTKEDIKEVFLQVAIYCGIPAGSTASARRRKYSRRWVSERGSENAAALRSFLVKTREGEGSAHVRGRSGCWWPEAHRAPAQSRRSKRLAGSVNGRSPERSPRVFAHWRCRRRLRVRRMLR